MFHVSQNRKMTSVLTASIDGIDQSVCVFAADTVDELSVRSFPRAVQAPETRDATCRARR